MGCACGPDRRVGRAATRRKGATLPHPVPGFLRPVRVSARANDGSRCCHLFGRYWPPRDFVISTVGRQTVLRDFQLAEPAPAPQQPGHDKGAVAGVDFSAAPSVLAGLRNGFDDEGAVGAGSGMTLMTEVRSEPAPVSSRRGRLFPEPEAAFRVVQGIGRIAPFAAVRVAPPPTRLAG